MTDDNRRRKKVARIKVARNEKNTYNDYVTPIIFVPGVMGSRLEFKSKNRWDPDAAWEMKHWLWASADKQREEMRCATFRDTTYNAVMVENGNYSEADGLVNEDIQRGWGGVSFKYHGKFLTDGKKSYYSENTNPLYASGYDWRDSNSKSGYYLEKKITAVLDAHKVKKCIIVTHSMGGLVTRASFRQKPELMSKVLTTVHLCQPVIGTPVAYRRFFTGVTAVYDGGASAAIFGLAVGNTGDKFSKVISVMDGPLQLLPADGYPNVKDAPWLRYVSLEQKKNNQIGYWNRSIYANYVDTVQPPGPIDGTAAGLMLKVRVEMYNRIVRAKALHDALRVNGKLFLHPLTFSIYSRGLTTDAIVEFEQVYENWYSPKRLDVSRYWVGGNGYALALNDWQRPKDGGDGTVAEQSAAALYPDQINILPPKRWQDIGKLPNGKDGVRQYLISGVEHAVAANDSEFGLKVSLIIHRVLRAFGRIK